MAQGPKRAGRAERIARRKAKPMFDPCPPGQLGGAYKPLTNAELDRIFDTALLLLDNLGLGAVPDRLRADLLAVGARDNGAGRILLPPPLKRFAFNLRHIRQL